jgi:hypothetical protein
MAGPANLHQIRFLLRSELGEQLGAVQERLEGRMGQLADELADMRKEGQCDEEGQQGMGQQGSDMVGRQQDVMREMREMLSICNSEGRSVDRSLQMEESRCMLQQLSMQLSSEGVGGGRRVAKMRDEVVEQLGGVEQRVKLLGQHMSEMDGVMEERMQEQEAVMGQRLGEVGRQVQHCVLELDRLPARLESVPEQLVLLGQRLDGEMLDMRDDMRVMRGQMEAGLCAVEERVREGMRSSQLRDVAGMEEMVEMSDQISAMSEQMSVMKEQLGLLPSQLRLLGRQCDEMKGQLGRLADEQAAMGKRVEEVQRGVKEQLEEVGKGQRDMLQQLEEVADEQHEMRRRQGEQLCDEVREVTEHAVQRSVHEGVNEKLSEIRKEMEQMRKLCGGLDDVVATVVEAEIEISKVGDEFDWVRDTTDRIWEYLGKEIGNGFGSAVRKDVRFIGDVLDEAVEGMRLVTVEMSGRYGKIEEVMRECQRQEVRVQECVNTAVSEEMSKSDERLRGVLRDLKGQLGVLQKEMRVGMMRVQQRGGRGGDVMSENGSSAAATELAEGRRAREKGAGLWEGVYEGQQGEGVQLFAGPPMQWVGGGRE